MCVPTLSPRHSRYGQVWAFRQISRRRDRTGKRLSPRYCGACPRNPPVNAGREVRLPGRRARSYFSACRSGHPAAGASICTVLPPVAFPPTLLGRRVWHRTATPSPAPSRTKSCPAARQRFARSMPRGSPTRPRQNARRRGRSCRHSNTATTRTIHRRVSMNRSCPFWSGAFWCIVARN